MLSHLNPFETIGVVLRCLPTKTIRGNLGCLKTRLTVILCFSVCDSVSVVPRHPLVLYFGNLGMPWACLGRGYVRLCSSLHIEFR
jgi:hypothetical protein